MASSDSTIIVAGGGGSAPFIATVPAKETGSKNWTSRIWLFLFNTILIFVSICVLVSGAIALKFVKVDDAADAGTTPSGLNAVSVAVGIRGIAITAIVMGCFFFATSIAGCIGGITRNNGMLSFFIGALILNVLFLTVYGSYSIFIYNKRMNAWKAVDASMWKTASDADKDLAQWAFGCCGFADYSDNPYTGAPLSDGESVNLCATKDVGSVLPGCKAAGASYWFGLLRNWAIIFPVGDLLLLITIGAAYHARRTYAGSSIVISADQQPLMKSR
ncbi:hypothetical protein DFJ73DRAFT_872913 [Zopfochytrium polystomum]|nr:hypothetical protein DFJ73DRAFT_872913 [Zopfochytrium polystomum]